MAGIWMGEETQERMDLGLTRALVLLSFAAHLTLALLAGIRRRKYSGVRRSLVWLAYYVTEIGTPIALSMVFIDTVNTDREQMFAFWAPFLVLHLGRPDNITSYALENKGLSPTQKVVLILEIGGAIYGSYKQRFMHGDGVLCAAFFIMLFFGSYKFVERVVALQQASLTNIRRSNRKKKLRQLSIEDVGHKWVKDNVLLDAHGLLGVTICAFAGYEVSRGGHRRILFSGWKEAITVVEMEASLMYDMLYTKARVIHTWGGYIIRVLSPLATSTAFYLLHSKEGQIMASADLVVTYILLVGTLLLDVRWLLTALGSTWAYAFLVDTEEDEEEESKGHRPWLKKAGRRVVRQSWYWLRRILVSLDPSRLSLRNGPSGHRLLPGSGVGQRNLLHECSTPQVKKETDVKDDLSEAVCLYILLDLENAEATAKLADYMRDNARICSLERNLIAFHVATEIFLLCRPRWTGRESEASARYEKRIRAVSDYMMFLLAQRQHMVLPPGDEGSQYKKACLDLKEIWREGGRTRGSQTTRETEQLANILLKMDETLDNNRKESCLFYRNDTLALGVDWALKLLHQLDPARYGSGQDATSVGIRSQVQSVHRLEDFILVFKDEVQTNINLYRNLGQQPKILDFMLWKILVSWVRILTFTSNKCSRDSHAKQLSHGGELLTIVWLMNQHLEQNIISW